MSQSPDDPNLYEMLARLRKVTNVVEFIDAGLIGSGYNPHSTLEAAVLAADLQLRDQEFWKELSREADVLELSETSQREVIAVYARRAVKAKRPRGWRG